MDPQYDVVVVGAGNGGLMCAAQCAKNGLKTLVLEKHNLPGGCATTFVRGRYEFEASLHELCSVGTAEKPDEVYRLFEKVGADPDWRYEHTMFRAVCTAPDGYDVTLSGTGDDPWDTFAQCVEDAVPGSKEGVLAIRDLVEHDKDAVAYITKMKGKPNPLRMITQYADFMRMAAYSAEDVMVALGLPAKARNILCTYWGYLGVPTDELKAFHYFNMVDGYVTDGAAFPRLKSHGLSEGLAKVILDNGGDIFYNTEVDGFVYDGNGAVCGVTAGGKEYRARRIVSNILANNVWNLSPAKNVPDKARQLANARSFGISVFTIYLGLDISKDELGLGNYTTFIQKSPRARDQYDLRANKGFYIVNCLNEIFDEATPEGTCQLFFTAQLDGSDIPDDLTPEEYKDWKNKLAQSYIADAEKVLGVDISSHVEEVVVATPVTFARYLGTPTGTIYAYRTAGWDSVMARTSAQFTDNTVQSLSFVGGQSTRGDGYSCAFISGDTTAERITNQLRAEDAAAEAVASGKAGE